MPKAPVRYNAVRLEPEETVLFRIDDGSRISLPIFREVGSSKELVCCDLCALFISLTHTRHTSYLQNHRGQDQCNREATRLRRETINQETAASFRALFTEPAQMDAPGVYYVFYISRILIKYYYFPL